MDCPNLRMLSTAKIIREFVTPFWIQYPQKPLGKKSLINLTVKILNHHNGFFILNILNYIMF